MFHEFPKALTNADGEQIIVLDAAQEAEANGNGFWFGGPHPLDHDGNGAKGGSKPARRKKGSE